MDDTKPYAARAEGERTKGPLLQLRDVSVSYGRKQIVHDLSLHLDAGEISVMLGHNGAGKTSTLGAIAGLISGVTGSIEVNGQEISRLTAAQRVARGVSFVPAQDFVFSGLSVYENLLLGGSTVADRRERLARIEQMLDQWPILRERRSQLADTMSGGQRRMLSVGIALMAAPKVLLLDEPSLGLAPKVVEDLFRDLAALAQTTNTAILLVEQSVAKALSTADHAFVLHSGRLTVSEPASEMLARGSWWDYF